MGLLLVLMRKKREYTVADFRCGAKGAVSDRFFGFARLSASRRPALLLRRPYFLSSDERKYGERKSLKDTVFP